MTLRSQLWSARVSSSAAALLAATAIGCGAAEVARPSVDVVAHGGAFAGQEIALVRALERSVLAVETGRCACTWTATVDTSEPEASSARGGRVSGTMRVVATTVRAACGVAEVSQEMRQQSAFGGSDAPLDLARTGLAHSVTTIAERLADSCASDERDAPPSTVE